MLPSDWSVEVGEEEGGIDRGGIHAQSWPLVLAQEVIAGTSKVIGCDVVCC